MNCKCERCGYEWWPRKNPKDIVSCASCKSRAWRTPPAPKKVESLEERNKREVREMENEYEQKCIDATPGGRCS